MAACNVRSGGWGLGEKLRAPAAATRLATRSQEAAGGGGRSPMEDQRWVVPLVVAALAYRLRLLQPGATVAGLCVGLAVVYSPNQPQHAAMLLTFFVAGSGSTKLTARLRRRRAAATTEKQGAAITRGGDGPRRSGRRRARSPSATPGASPTTGAIRDASDAADAKRGRSLEQVIAVGLVPTLLCLGQERCHPQWQLCYLCYLATCAGDTLASEFGSLAAKPPLLVTTLQPVAAGTDGAISLPGTLASLLGGALVGGCSGTVSGLVQGMAAGGVGSLLDSLLGVALQSPSRLAGRPRLWKSLNCLVNLLSASVIAGMAPTALEHAELVLPALGLLLLLLCTATSNRLSGTAARKVLHLGTSILIVVTDRAHPAHLPGVGSATRALMIAVAAAAVLGGGLSWQRRWRHSPLLRFESAASQPAPGITLYATAVLLVLLAQLPIDASLGPLFFGDPAAALVGRAVAATRRHTAGGGKSTGGGTGAGGGKKTAAGSAAFALVTTLWFAFCCIDSTGDRALYGSDAAALWVALGKGLLLAAVEYASGAYDNIVLPIATTALNSSLRSVMMGTQ